MCQDHLHELLVKNLFLQRFFLSKRLARRRCAGGQALARTLTLLTVTGLSHRRCAAGFVWRQALLLVISPPVERSHACVFQLGACRTRCLPLRTVTCIVRRGGCRVRCSTLLLTLLTVAYGCCGGTWPRLAVVEVVRDSFHRYFTVTDGCRAPPCA